MGAFASAVASASMGEVTIKSAGRTKRVNLPLARTKVTDRGWGAAVVGYDSARGGLGLLGWVGVGDKAALAELE